MKELEKKMSRMSTTDIQTRLEADKFSPQEKRLAELFLIKRGKASLEVKGVEIKPEQIKQDVTKGYLKGFILKNPEIPTEFKKGEEVTTSKLPGVTGKVRGTFFYKTRGGKVLEVVRIRTKDKQILSKVEFVEKV